MYTCMYVCMMAVCGLGAWEYVRPCMCVCIYIYMHMYMCIRVCMYV